MGTASTTNDFLSKPKQRASSTHEKPNRSVEVYVDISGKVSEQELPGRAWLKHIGSCCVYEQRADNQAALCAWHYN